MRVERRRAVRADDPQVLEPVVVGDAVDVVEDQRHRGGRASARPGRRARTRRLLEAACEEPLLELARGCTLRVLDEDLRRAGSAARSQLRTLARTSRGRSGRSRCPSCRRVLPEASRSCRRPRAGRAARSASASCGRSRRRPRELCSGERHRGHEHMFAPVTDAGRTSGTKHAELGGPDSNPDLTGPKPAVLPLHHPPNRTRPVAASRYYDASGVRAHGRHPRRRRGNAHALRAAQGPAPALRAPADPVARRRRAGGRRRARSWWSTTRSGGSRTTCPRASRSPIQQRAAAAPATRSPRPRAHIDADAHRGGHQRRRAADHRRGDRRRSSRPTRTAGAAGDDGDDGARRPARLRARDPRRRRQRRARRRGQGRRATRRPSELAIREVNTGVYAFDGGALLAALDQLDTDNAQGELYLPDVLPTLARRGQGRSPRTRSPTRRSRSASTTASTSPTSAGSRSSASTSATARNGVTIVDPDSTLHRRRRRRSAATPSIEPVDAPAAATRAIGEDCRDRPAARR